MEIITSFWSLDRVDIERLTINVPHQIFHDQQSSSAHRLVTVSLTRQERLIATPSNVFFVSDKNSSLLC